MDAAQQVAERYARFARDEAAGRSEVYEQWGSGVARDPALQRVIARLPETRRQPPLVFAVARMLGAPVGPYEPFAEWVRAHDDLLVREAAARSLQTNEPLRTAALLPAMSEIAGPVALIEIGASAGLCLYPDRYSYRYSGLRDTWALDPAGGPSGVVLDCRVEGDGVFEPVLPQVVWRAGIDLVPLDARKADDRRFLRGLVWPGEEGREQRIEDALQIVAAEPPVLVRGDATSPGVVADVVAMAPAGARVVMTTPGVLPHIPRAGRTRLAETLRALPVEWISIEPAAFRDEGGGFVVVHDDRVVASCDPLGAWLEWRTSVRGQRA